MPKSLIIDGKPIEVDDGITLIEACSLAGSDVPRFCYHRRLSIAGNCRMCLIEVQGSPKPVASCAMGVNDLPPNKDGSPKIISTTSPMVKKAREGVMEFLLINHPLDCPICDQGGECDLQDQALAFGVGGSRYTENKRAVEEKHLGPLIKTAMTRCIQCTRCVRFMTEVAGVEELGAIGRGEDMEITTYLEKGMMSEMSANVVDLCPVGALTHRPWAFHARPWEMSKTDSVDVMDAVGSAIRVDVRGREVMRILPRTNDAVNEEWISDKARHIADGLRVQRLDRPYARKDGRLQPVSWTEALELLAAKLKAARPERIGAIVGDLAGAEEMFVLQDLWAKLGSPNLDCRQDGLKIDPAAGRAGYLFNTAIAGIDKADAMLIVGANPRIEATVLNARIRRRWRQGGLNVGLIGPRVDLTYAYEHLGIGPQSLVDMVLGKYAFAGAMKQAKHPMVIVGSGVAARPDGAQILSLAARLALDVCEGKESGWSAFNVLHMAASRVAGLDLGLVPKPGGLDAQGQAMAARDGKLDVLYLLGADEIRLPSTTGCFVVYQGSHGDAGAHRADLILPGSAYTEKSATYVNLEGRAQVTGKAAFPPGDAKEDWKIIRALSDALGSPLAYGTLGEVRQAMYRKVPGLAAIGKVAPAGLSGVEALARVGGSCLAEAFPVTVEDFYFTNPIARASAVMAELSALQRASRPTALKAAE